MVRAIDCHIHLDSLHKGKDLVRAMDAANIENAILLGSSKFTFTLNPADGFTLYHENNLELLRVKAAFPGRFEIWPTIDPLAADNCHRILDYVAGGASGLKLYVGHGHQYGHPPRYMFHTTAIDSDPMRSVYQLCQRINLPICLHINTTNSAPGFREEFEHVCEEFPQLRILAPHWMLASGRPSYIRDMFERFSNVWTDTSFGQDAILVDGMRRIADNQEAITQLITDYPDRVLFGSDIVCTNTPHKTVNWLYYRMMAYKDMLSKPEYECPVTGEVRPGLHLPPEILSKILHENAEALL